MVQIIRLPTLRRKPGHTDHTNPTDQESIYLPQKGSDHVVEIDYLFEA